MEKAFNKDTLIQKEIFSFLTVYEKGGRRRKIFRRKMRKEEKEEKEENTAYEMKSNRRQHGKLRERKIGIRRTTKRKIHMRRKLKNI
jgi:hypothetical protein